MIRFQQSLSKILERWEPEELILICKEIYASGECPDDFMKTVMILKDVQFADDQAMVASTEASLQNLMESMSNKCKEYDLKIHVNKTRVMKISRKQEENLNIIRNGQKVEQVSHFKYLGSLLTEDGGSDKEIKARIAMAKEAFNNKKVLLSKSLSKYVKQASINYTTVESRVFFTHQIAHFYAPRHLCYSLKCSAHYGCAYEK